MTEGGIYSLVITLDRATTVEIGALGPVAFEPGAYLYVGSAHGPAGFDRVDRHCKLAAGDRSTRHWHIDYLLTDPGSGVARAVTTAGIDAECTLARSLSGEGVTGFGCSDCDCSSHLIHYTKAPRAIRDAIGAQRTLARSSTSQ